MLRDAAVDLLMKRLGNRTDASLRDSIINEMVEAQKTVLEADYPLPWFLIKKDAALVTVAGTDVVALPTDFIAAWESGGLARVDTDGNEIKLVRKDYDIIRKEKVGEGTPNYYDIIGDNLYLRFIPDSIISLTLWYYGSGASLAGTYGDANNVENAWLKHASDWLIAETGIVIASSYLQSIPMAGTFAAQAKTAKNRLATRITAREEEDKQQYMEG